MMQSLQIQGMSDIQTSLQNIVRSINALQQTTESGFANLQMSIPMVYGSFYANNIAYDVVVASADTFYEIGGDLSGGRERLCTFQNAKEIKITQTGDYLINYSISAHTPAPNKEVEAAIMINGTEQTVGSSHGELSMIGAGSPSTVSGTAILSLSVDDLVSLSLANKTDTTDVTVQHVSMTILMVAQQ